MTDKPILFSAPMIQAIRAGRKTQTRRLLSRLGSFGKVTQFDPSDTRGYDWHFRDKGMRWHDLRDAELRKALPYAIGNRLWVRETFSYETLDVERNGFMPPWYWADGNPESGDFTRPKPSIHMPRWASRLTLIVTEVRVERLQDISSEDAQAEGAVNGFHDWDCQQPYYPDPAGYCVSGCGNWSYVEVFQRLWESIHGADAWAANPWVSAISFETHLCNIDALPA